MFLKRLRVESHRGRIGRLPEPISVRRGRRSRQCNRTAEAQRLLEHAHLELDRVVVREPCGRFVERPQRKVGVLLASAVRRVKDVHPGGADYVGTDVLPARGGAGAPIGLVVSSAQIRVASEPDQIAGIDAVQIIGDRRGRCARCAKGLFGPLGRKRPRRLP